MSFVRLLVIAGVLLLFAPVVRAQRDPFLGHDEYPQFRNVSGLGGGGYGLDARGYGSQEGPTALSTPIGYTLGHDQFRFALAEMSFNSGYRIGLGNVNGSAFIAYGHTFGSVNVAFSNLFLSKQLDSALNLQVQFIPSARSKWSSSIGAQDLVGHGGNSGLGVSGNRALSRSLFAAFTYRIDTQRRPVYVSAGLGTVRFRQGFGSVSYQVYGPIRTWVEFDGYGFNEGLLFSLRSSRQGRGVEVNTTLAWVRGRFPTIGTSFGF